MSTERGRSGVASALQERQTMQMPAIGATWDSRLYPGLRVACVPSEIRALLADALGELGVEAEHFLSLLTYFPGRGRPTRARGEAFLLRLDIAMRRLYRVATRLEVATQSYLTSLENGYPDIRQGSASADVWWQAPDSFSLAGEPLEIRLRRCGYAYRHVIAVHLAANIEAVAEHLVMVLQALSTLPPAGVAPASTLYRGLDELTTMLQGYLIPNHVTDMNPQTPGILTGIARLRMLDAREDISLRTDIAWARAQYAFVYHTHYESGTPQTRAWAVMALREWQETITVLESLDHTAALPHRR